MKHKIRTLSDSLAYAEKLRRKYRESLIAVGKSPDYHVYDLTVAFLSSLRPCTASRCLIAVKHFYDSLGVRDQAIFVNEVLEKDRHYPFWFMDGRFAKNEYEKCRTALLCRLPERL